jgi:hypothetical protein
MKPFFKRFLESQLSFDGTVVLPSDSGSLWGVRDSNPNLQFFPFLMKLFLKVSLETDVLPIKLWPLESQERIALS